MQFSHVPVLKKELIDSLNISSGATIVDCTAGLGGHIEAILERYNNVRIIAIDKDEDVFPYLIEKFKNNNSVSVINSDYKNIDDILSFFDIDSVDAIYADLGFSSYQIDNSDRGFSFKSAKLDMRFSKKQTLTAHDVVNKESEESLYKIIRDYGDEIYARAIAKKIVWYRKKQSIETTKELQGLVHSVYKRKNKRRWRIDPATKTFQAIRIFVNKEFETIKILLDKVEKVLKKGGRFAVISFHSGEDRLIKKTFNLKVNPCTCPPDFPVCVCGKEATFRWVNKTPITASKEEINENPRARSAKLRVLERL